jgi:hypothetical protein
MEAATPKYLQIPRTALAIQKSCCKQLLKRTHPVPEVYVYNDDEDEKASIVIQEAYQRDMAV